MKSWKSIFNNIYLKNVLLAVAIIVLLVFGVLWWLDIYTRHGRSVIIPDIKGLQVGEAEVILRENTLTFEVVDSVFNKDVAPGAILETVPPMGTKVKEHRKLYVTINAFNSQTAVIPEFKDQSQRQAIAKLNSIGFKSIEVKYVPGAYRDLVVGLEFNGREVNPGQRLPVESRLLLLVSNGSNFHEGSEDSLEMEFETSEPAEVDESWF